MALDPYRRWLLPGGSCVLMALLGIAFGVVVTSSIKKQQLRDEGSARRKMIVARCPDARNTHWCFNGSANVAELLLRFVALNAPFDWP